MIRLLNSPGLSLRSVAHMSQPLRSTRSVKTSTLDWKPIKSSTTNIALKQEQAKNPIFRKVFLTLMCAMPVISFGLGCWQVQRLDWKSKLIARSEYLLSLPPTELPMNIDPAEVGNFEYKRVILKGHFDYEQELFLGPRFRGEEMGYVLVTPFVRADGKALLVDRGWISKEKVLPSKRSNGYLLHLARPAGEIEIEALLRVMPPRSTLQYEHTPNSRQFFVPDVEAMALESGALPIYCQAIHDRKDHPEWNTEGAERKRSWFGGKPKSQTDSRDSTMEFQNFEFINEGVPLGTVPKVTFKNNHLQYLVTWFGLLFFSAGLLIYQLRKGRTGGAENAIEAKRRHMKNWDR